MFCVKMRLGWIRLYEATGDAGVVCRRCGISRPTLREWLRRFQEAGEAGLVERSRRPLRQAKQKVFEPEESLILSLRRERKLEIEQLRTELIRYHDVALSLDTLHRVLCRHGEQVLKRPRRRTKGTKRYKRPVPGDRVQMDVCKIAPGVYQYTAIDDCSRYKVLGVYRRRTAANTLDFLERLIEETPFSAHPDRSRPRCRGCAANADGLGDKVPFHKAALSAPEWQGRTDSKTQRADLEEFWSTVDPKAADIEDRIAELRHHWNWHRPHAALGGGTPVDRVCDLANITPFTDQVESRFDPTNERIRIPEYRFDRAFAALK